MAKCTHEKEVVKVIKEEKFHLELTRDEANIILSVFGKIAGGYKNQYSALTDGIYDALRVNLPPPPRGEREMVANNSKIEVSTLSFVE